MIQKFIQEGDLNYEQAKKISNSRLNFKPSGIYYCENEEDIIDVLKYCNENNFKFRIRSGGHHHEGASTGDDVIIIDTTKMKLPTNCLDSIKNKIVNANNQIAIDTCSNTMHVMPGVKLDDIYKFLKKNNYILPGGGCESVNIGGLVQGGGWGPYSRLYGMTCDALIQAKIVVKKCENFEVITISNNCIHKDLFKAIKGSGGGNFGIITELKFHVYPLSVEGTIGSITTIKATYSNIEDAKDVAKKWMKNAHKVDNRITSFARCTPRSLDSNKKSIEPQFVLTAYITDQISSEEGALKLLHNALELFPTILGDKDIVEYHNNTIEINSQFFTPDAKNTKNLNNSNKLNLAAHKKQHETFNSFQNSNHLIQAPSSTCDTPHPHKISSSFPKIKTEVDIDKLVEDIYNYMNKKNKYINPEISAYISLHGMGGKMNENHMERSFHYGNKPFMLQIQAWWEETSNPNKENYLNWVEEFRKELTTHTEGCFVNFPDYNIVKENDEFKFSDKPILNNNEREKFLKIIYKESLFEELQEVKKKYDKSNFFNHTMSIPLKK